MQVITLNVQVTSLPLNYLFSGSLRKPIEWAPRIDVLFVVTVHCTFLHSPFSRSFYSTPRSLLPPRNFHSSSLPSQPLLLFILLRIICIIIMHVFYIFSTPFLLILPHIFPSLQSATNYYLNIASFRYCHPLSGKKLCAQILSPVKTVIFLKIACIHSIIIFSSRLLPVSPPPAPFLVLRVHSVPPPTNSPGICKK